MTDLENSKDPIREQFSEERKEDRTLSRGMSIFVHGDTDELKNSPPTLPGSKNKVVPEENVELLGDT